MQSTKIEQLTPAEVQLLIDEHGEGGIAIIDVREPWEFESDTGHAKGSILIPMNDIPEKMEEIRRMSAQKKVGFICHSGERSFHVCRYLKENGIDNIFNIYGGMIKWSLSGLEVEYGGES